MLADVFCSSVGTVAEYGLLFLVQLVTVAELVVSAPPRSLQSAEPSAGLVQVFAQTCHYVVVIPLLQGD